MLVRKESRSNGVQRAWSNFKERGLVEDYGDANYSSRVEANAQKQLEQSSRESLEEALTSLERTPQLPSVEELACILHKCRKKKNLTYTKRLHACICKNGLEDHRSLGNHLVPLWVQGGSMYDAQHVFDSLVVRKVQSWTFLIMGYIECGELQHALKLYHKMQEDSVDPSKYTYVALLKACARLKHAERGQEIHAEIARKGLERDLFVGSTLVDMYAKCGLLAKARQAIDRLPVRNEVSWNALIAGYGEHGLGEEALDCFEEMQLDSVSPNAVTFVSTLKACGNLRVIDKGREIHAEIAIKGLERNCFIGSTLVDMYAKCGLLAKALEVFDRLPVQDIVSWTALIAGYAEHGPGEEALDCFEKMQLEGISPDAVSFGCSLKACGSIKNIDKGQEIHAEIARKELERDLFVGSTLVDMYVKCGLLAKAWEAFSRLPVRNEVSWNALVAGYAEHGLGEEVLSCFEQMHLEGVAPNAVTFVCSLKACGCVGAIDKGQEIHTEIARKGLERDLFVGSTLVDMYAKCGRFAKSQEVFDMLPARDVVAWTALMAGYTEHGRVEETLHCFEWMRLEGISPDTATCICSMKACGCIGALDKGQGIHAEIARRGFERDLFVGRTLVDMYVKCGSLSKAQEVFDTLAIRDVVSWTALIAGYAEHGLGAEALIFFEQMQLEDVFPDATAFVCSLKACSSIGAIDTGQEIHAEIARMGLERDLFVGNTLVDMYAKCGLLAEVREVFDRLHLQDEVSWNALISGYAEHGCSEEALNCFEEMQLEGVSPNAVTFACGLKAYGCVGNIDKARELHGDIARKGLERDLFVGSTLVDMYAKCGSLVEAQELFDGLSVRNEILWNALIAGYAEHGLGEEALVCFERMELDCVSPNAVTFVSSLKACGSIGAKEMALEIHAEIARKGLERDLFVGSTLVDMYAKCGLLAKAQEVFDRLPAQDNVLWSALIGGYDKHGFGEKVLNCFLQMQLEGVSPNAVTFVCTLKACGRIAAIDEGQEIHAEIARMGLESELFVSNTLVDMYANCGSLSEAREMFDKLPVRDEISWNALITGYAHVGKSEDVFHLLETMREEGIKPGCITFINVLTVCSHTGLVENGQRYFEAMSKDYGISPTIEHHTCMVDLLGRAGQLDEALAVAKKMPFHPNLVVWHTMLGACQKWGNVELGRQAFEHAVYLDETDVAAYVLMSNIYGEAYIVED